MNRLILLAVFSFGLCTMLAAQQATQAGSTSAVAAQPAVDAQPSVVAEHNEAIKSARTIGIDSKTVFLNAVTLERALMMQKNWDKLNLSIVTERNAKDLKIEVDRISFTHIHTYAVVDVRTGIVLAAGRVRAIDGIVASGPMAEQIVKILYAAQLHARATNGE